MGTLIHITSDIAYLCIASVAVLQTLTVLMFLGRFHIPQFGQSVSQTCVVQASNIHKQSITKRACTRTICSVFVNLVFLGEGTFFFFFTGSVC